MARQRSPFLYQLLVDKYVGMIDSGLMKPGDRLPSLRQVSQNERISLTTALQVFGLLESRGYIRAKPQSGYFVLDRDRPSPEEHPLSPRRFDTAQVNISDLAAVVLRNSQMPNIVPLGAASPGPTLVPSRALNRLLIGQIRRHDRPQGQEYSYPPGEYDLRRQIALRSGEWGGGLTPDQIVVTVGGTQAIDLCLRAVTNPGDLVVIETPCYFGTLMLLETLGLSALEVPSPSQGGICLDMMAEALGSYPVRACIVSPCFSNPSGSCMSDRSKQALVAMASRRGIPLIEDDTYGDLGYVGARPRPAKAFDENGGVMLCSSFSKLLAPGYRIGWTVPGRFRDRLEHLQLASTLAVPKIFQATIADFLGSGAYDRHLRKIRASVALQSVRMIEAIGRYFPPGTRVARPRGGIVLWVELPEGSDAVQLSSQAALEGICICPGPIFSATRGYQNFIRLNAGFPWSPALDRALCRLGELIKNPGP